jgi:hypothetical protein
MLTCRNEVLAKRLCHTPPRGSGLRFRSEQPATSNEQTGDYTASLVGHMTKVVRLAALGSSERFAKVGKRRLVRAFCKACIRTFEFVHARLEMQHYICAGHLHGLV